MLFYTPYVLPELLKLINQLPQIPKRETDRPIRPGLLIRPFLKQKPSVEHSLEIMINTAFVAEHPIVDDGFEVLDAVGAVGERFHLEGFWFGLWVRVMT